MKKSAPNIKNADIFNNIIIKEMKNYLHALVKRTPYENLKGGDFQEKIAQKYKIFLTILNNLSSLQEDKKQEIIKNMQLFLKNTLQMHYNIPLDPLVFAMSGSAGVGAGMLMSAFSPFQFVGNTLADIGRGMTIIFTGLGVALLPLFRSLLEKRKFIKEVMKNIYSASKIVKT